METIVIRNGTVVNENSAAKADVLLHGGKITAVGHCLPGDIAVGPTIDATGMVVLPGLIDSHVHYYAAMGDGRTADDFISGSISAACGGFTTVVDYAPPLKGLTLAQSLAVRRAEIDGYTHCDYNLHAEILGWHTYDPSELRQLPELGVNSLKIYTTYGADRLDSAQIERLFQAVRAAGLRVCIHAEDDAICYQNRERMTHEGKTAHRYHAQSRPARAESQAIEAALSLAEKTSAPIHIVHVSTRMGIQAIRAAKARGVDITCETCPHYLLLDESCYEKADAAKYIMTPPLRREADREALWAAVLDGTVDCIVSDHCAFTLAQKLASETCFDNLPGIPGTETILPLIYTEGQRRGLTLPRLVQLLSAAPARLFGLWSQKGRIAPGADADLCLWDPGRTGTLTADALHSRAGYSPYEGMPVAGSVFAVIRRGKVLVRGGAFEGEKPEGRFVKALRPPGG